MTGSILRRGLVPAVALCLVSCGGGDGSPAAPSAPVAAQTPQAATRTSGAAMPAETSGVKPDGFDASIRVDPKPGEDGVIRGDSPLELTVDMCHSTPGEGAPLTYLADWNFDSFADAAGTGDDCVFTHRFSVPAGATPSQRSLRANVCVVSGNPNFKGPNTYFSCRAIRLELVPAREKQLRLLDDTACAHSACVTGGVLLGSCSPCVADIIAVDSYCGNTAWDGLCVSRVRSTCGYDGCLANQDPAFTFDLSSVSRERN